MDSKYLKLRFPTLKVEEPPEREEKVEVSNPSALRMTGSQTTLNKKYSLPPSLDAEVSFKFSGLFFANSAAATIIVSRQSLAAAMGFVAQSATTGACIATSYRIKALTYWTPLSAAGGGALAQTVEWIVGGTAEQGLQKDHAKVQVIVPGQSLPSGVRLVPPKGTYAAMWQSAASNPTDQILQLNANSGTVFQLDCECTMSSAAVALPSIGSVTGLTAGRYYRYSLDTTASGNIIHSAVASAF